MAGVKKALSYEDSAFSVGIATWATRLDTWVNSLRIRMEKSIHIQLRACHVQAPTGTSHEPLKLNLCKEFLPGPFGFGFDLFDVQFGEFFMA